ncbi:MAG: CARDB domain-containing protein [Thermodesulfobacteriota bacterium]
MHFKQLIILNFIILLFCTASIHADVQHKFIKRSNTTGLYPDIQITENVIVAENKIDPLKTVYLKSIAAVKKKDGRCAVAIDYEIYNKGAIDVNNRFYSSIESYGTTTSSRLIDGIGAGESKIIESVIWLKPGEITNAVIFLDNHNNVKETSELNNTRELTLLLTGNCDTELNEPVDKGYEKKGLLKRFEFKFQ